MFVGVGKPENLAVNLATFVLILGFVGVMRLGQP